MSSKEVSLPVIREISLLSTNRDCFSSGRQRPSDESSLVVPNLRRRIVERYTGPSGHRTVTLVTRHVR